MTWRRCNVVKILLIWIFVYSNPQRSHYSCFHTLHDRQCRFHVEHKKTCVVQLQLKLALYLLKCILCCFSSTSKRSKHIYISGFHVVYYRQCKAYVTQKWDLPRGDRPQLCSCGLMLNYKVSEETRSRDVWHARPTGSWTWSGACNPSLQLRVYSWPDESR